jgi:hypothetical protein
MNASSRSDEKINLPRGELIRYTTIKKSHLHKYPIQGPSLPGTGTSDRQIRHRQKRRGAAKSNLRTDPMGKEERGSGTPTGARKAASRGGRERRRPPRRGSAGRGDAAGGGAGTRALGPSSSPSPFSPSALRCVILFLFFCFL